MSKFTHCIAERVKKLFPPKKQQDQNIDLYGYTEWYQRRVQYYQDQVDRGIISRKLFDAYLAKFDAQLAQIVEYDNSLSPEEKAEDEVRYQELMQRLCQRAEIVKG